MTVTTPVGKRGERAVSRSRAQTVRTRLGTALPIRGTCRLDPPPEAEDETINHMRPTAALASIGANE